jgi:transposase
MASLTKKIINGRKYYYARICKRINGKPKIVQTIYLGTLEKIIDNAHKAKDLPQAAEVHLAELGATAALLDIAKRLQLVEIVDRHAPKRRQGPSVGQYMLVAAINRAIHPTSKASLAEWFEKTVAARLMGIQPSQLSSQAFWNHMERLKAETLIEIENDLLVRLIDEFEVDLNCLLYDATNFYTYINTRTESELAQRGHNKQKRNDLRQVSLGMMTSSDFHIPLLHMVYGGNINDSTQFGSVIDELIRRYRCLTEACPQVTLIFDKGNNSEANLERLPQTGLHFVGSLRLNQCPQLLKVPLRKFRSMKPEELRSVKAYRQRRIVFAAERTVVVTYNENLLAGQLQGIGRHLAKTRKELHALQGKLKRRAAGKTRGGRKPTVQSVQRQVNKMLRREYMKEIIRVGVTSVDDNVALHYAVDPNAIGRLSRTVLGKTILFTDNHDWTDEQIIRGYRAQYHIEHAFREMKNPHFLCWNPRRHWTDGKIRVHAFYCVGALTLVGLLRRELAAAGLRLSAERLMEHLSGIYETISVYPQGRKAAPQLSYSLSHLNPTQKQLYELLDLGRFRSV